MTKNYLLIPFLVTSCKLFFQEACFLVVNNFTKHPFKISDTSPTMQLQTVAAAYGIGYSIPFNVNKK